MDSGSYSQHRIYEKMQDSDESQEKKGVSTKSKSRNDENPNNYRFNTGPPSSNRIINLYRLLEVLKSRTSLLPDVKMHRFDELRKNVKSFAAESCRHLVIKDLKESKVVIDENYLIATGRPYLTKSGVILSTKPLEGLKPVTWDEVHKRDEIKHDCLRGQNSKTAGGSGSEPKQQDQESPDQSERIQTQKLVEQGIKEEAKFFGMLSKTLNLQTLTKIATDASAGTLKRLLNLKEFSLQIIDEIFESREIIKLSPVVCRIIIGALLRLKGEYLSTKFVIDMISRVLRKTAEPEIFHLILTVLFVSKGADYWLVRELIHKNLEWMVDHGIGFHIINTLLVGGDQMVSRTLGWMSEVAPVQLFVKKYRKAVFLCYLSNIDSIHNFPSRQSTDINLRQMINQISKVRSNIRYILKRDVSAWMLVMAITSIEDYSHQDYREICDRIESIRNSDSDIRSLDHVAEVIECMKQLAGAYAYWQGNPQ